jgi:endonuclease III
MPVSQTTSTTRSSISSSSLHRLRAMDKNDDDDDDDLNTTGAADELPTAAVASAAESAADSAAESSRPKRRRLKLKEDADGKSSSNTAQESPVASRTTRTRSSSRIIRSVVTPLQLDAERTKSKVKTRASSSSTTASKVVGAAVAKRKATTLTSSNASAAATAAAVPPTPQSSTPKAAVAAANAAAPPQGWEDIYSLVVELRQDRTAPCDISGCEALAAGDDSDDSSCSPQEFRLRALISLILSSQTKDAVVGEAVRHLIRDGVLTVSALLAMSPDRLCHHYLAKVGFRNNKTRYIQETCRILQEQFQNDIPPTAALMMELLPGVGPKMAFICESVAWKRQSGIGVDTHMHRVFALLGWVKQPCKTPEHTRQQLEAWLPHSYWADVNLLWVGFGQQVQQEKPKLLRKALSCSRPAEALRLLKRCGLDYNKEAKKLNLQDEIQQALSLAQK